MSRCLACHQPIALHLRKVWPDGEVVPVCPVPLVLDGDDFRSRETPIQVEQATHIEPTWTSPEETN